MSQVGKYLNLKPHMSSWRVYKQGGPYTTAYSIGALAPSQFGGLSYRIREEKGNDVYLIQTESFGLCAIWAPRDNDSTITTSPAYPNGDLSTGITRPSNSTLINYAKNRGIFKDASVTILEFDKKSNVAVISLVPLVTLQAELSLTAQLVGPYSVIDISASSGTVATSYKNKLTNLGIDFEGVVANFQTAFSTLALTGDINNLIKYKVAQVGTTMVITFEATMSYEGVNLYQRLIITVSKGSYSFVRVPVIATANQTVSNTSTKYNTKESLITIGIVLGTIAIGVVMGIQLVTILGLVSAVGIK